MAQIPIERVARNSRKGKAVMELLGSNNNVGKGSSAPLATLSSETEADLDAWLRAVNAALAAVAAEDAASVGSAAASSLSAGDNESLASSEDSRGERRQTSSAHKPPQGTQERPLGALP